MFHIATLFTLSGLLCMLPSSGIDNEFALLCFMVALPCFVEGYVRRQYERSGFLKRLYELIEKHNLGNLRGRALKDRLREIAHSDTASDEDRNLAKQLLKENIIDKI